MSKPARFLQGVCFLVGLAGCAGHQSAAVPESTARHAPAAAAPAPGPGPSLTAVPEAVPIQAGRSIADGGPFLQPDGSLVPEIRAYAENVAQLRQVPLAHVESLLASAQYDPAVVRLMKPSPRPIRRSWTVYRERFVDPIRIRDGQQFWEQNRAFLDATAKQYGVPPSIIVAIIGVETVYGRHTGTFRVLDALTTLGFRYPDPTRPERSQLFRDQLADLIQLDYEQDLDARTVTGSYAGAMGLPQFMPGSLMRYAADGDGDGRIDLMNSTQDAIASVARFLRLHGWVPGLPVFAPAVLPRDPAALVHGGLSPTLSWQALKAQGAALLDPGTGPAPAWTEYKLGIVDLVDESRKRAEYRLGTPNFFAITHYNRSYFYAASVADLAKILSERMGYGAP